MRATGTGVEFGISLLVAGPPLPGVVPACELVVAGEDPGPGGQLRGSQEVLRGAGADLGDDGGGRQLPDAGDGHEEADGGLKPDLGQISGSLKLTGIVLSSGYQTCLPGGGIA